MLDIIKDGFRATLTSYRDFQGTGLIVALFLFLLVYLAFSQRNSYVKDALVKYPVYVLLVFFCPVWYVYVYLFEDYEILYRILWLLPLGVVICYTLTEVVLSLNEKFRIPAFVVAIVVLVICGEYTYSSEYITLAENEYHVPDTVVKICDEISVEGREIRAAFPDEFLFYVRQYTTKICLPYGREMFMNFGSWGNELQKTVNADVIDSEACAFWLRDTETPYLIVSSSKKFTENISAYDFVYVTSIDGYDIYLDNNAYIGSDFD